MGTAVSTDDYHEAAARAMSERGLQEHVRGLARWLGLHYYHTYDSRRSTPGFPDVVLVGDGGALWRELKTERGRVTEMQMGWLDALTRAGQDAAVWRPSDLLAGRIENAMQRIAQEQQ